MEEIKTHKLSFPNDESPAFTTKKGLAKWAKLTYSDEIINEGVVYTDSKMTLYIYDSKTLYSLLETTD